MQDTTTDDPTAPGTSPVDDVTYDLLQALTSKLEAIEAYRMYAADGTEAAGLFQRLATDDSEHAEQLLDALRDRLQQR
ncbi:MAG: hypothetical protein HYX57_10955 [Chloroflexi bacterium]|nr:hypothetical protein [Chloroflexota bacterium]